MVLSLRLSIPEGTWVQWLGGVAAMQMQFVSGLAAGWSSPYLAQFLSENPPFPATINQITWMASVYHLGRLPGGTLGAMSIEYFGNKTAMICNGFLLLISWTFIILANSPGFIYASQIIFGASDEIASLSYALYLGDISSPKIRGALIAMAGNGIVIGTLVGNAMGPYVSMKIYACVCLIPTISFLLLFFWLPHSPYHLVSKDKIKEAEKSLARYNPKANPVDEIENIKKFVQTSKSIKLIDRFRELIIPRNRKLGMTITILIMLAQFSGVDPMLSYMQSILTRGMVTVIAPSTVPIIASSLGFISGLVTMYLTETLGRKIMWIVSSAGICGSMIILGTHFYLLANGSDTVTLQWLPILSMLSFRVFYSVGLNCIPYILIGELLPANIRTLVGCISSVSNALLAFVIIYGYPFLIQLINEAYVYWVFSIFMLVSVVLGILLVPDMKGKTLSEIQDILSKN